MAQADIPTPMGSAIITPPPWNAWIVREIAPAMPTSAAT